MTQEISTIEALLGDPADRYFSEQYRHFQFDITHMETVGGAVCGTLASYYRGRERPRNERVHIGSIEYLSLALRLAFHTLNRIGRIGLSDLNGAFMRSYRVKLAQPLYIGPIPFRCELLQSALDLGSLQGSTSRLAIELGGNRAVLEIDHRGGGRYRHLPVEQRLCTGFEQLYSTGYRRRRPQLEQIRLDPQQRRIEAAVHSGVPLERNALYGIGSAQQMLLPTEATQVFGQLMQALLYRIGHTDRKRCPNIWLRRMDLQCGRPMPGDRCRAWVHFEEMRRVEHRGHPCQLVHLKGRVGHFQGIFDIYHQTPLL